MQPPDLRERVRVLEADNDTLRETIAQLQALLTPEIAMPLVWNLPFKELALFRCLLAREVCSKRYLHLACYGSGSEVSEAVVESHMSKLRKRLTPFGVEITSKRHEGYRLVDRASWNEKLRTKT